MSFLDGSMGKKSACNAGDIGDSGSIPGRGRFPRGGNGNPFQYSSLGNSMHRGTWQAIVHGATRVRHDWLHTHTHTHTHSANREAHCRDRAVTLHSLRKNSLSWKSGKVDRLRKVHPETSEQMWKKARGEGWRHYRLVSVLALLQIIRLFFCHL